MLLEKATLPDLHNLSPKSAHALLQEHPRSVLVDIRSSMEYLFIGHPVGAIHLAWIDEPDWEENPNFASEVQQLLENRFKDCVPKQDVTVVLICRSGERSREAATVLLGDGFKRVMHVNEGFEGLRDENHHRGTLGGWRFHGLPWEQC